MQANTKLSDNQKIQLRNLRSALPEVKVVNLNNKTTIAYVHKGNTVEFALSVMAPTENKFRPKVGEYYARLRYMGENTVKMDKDDFLAMCDCLWDAYPF